MEAGGLYRLASLDAKVSGEDEWEPSSWLAVEDRELADTDDRVTVEALLALLPERERRIMYLRFFEGLTQSEIAEQIGVSQMHVSRLLSRSIDALGEVARTVSSETAVATHGA
jgi:RNA polymerase sigma-B factor